MQQALETVGFRDYKLVNNGYGLVGGQQRRERLLLVEKPLFQVNVSGRWSGQRIFISPVRGEHSSSA